MKKTLKEIYRAILEKCWQNFRKIFVKFYRNCEKNCISGFSRHITYRPEPENAIRMLMSPSFLQRRGCGTCVPHPNYVATKSDIITWSIRLTLMSPNVYAGIDFYFSFDFLLINIPHLFEETL